MKKLLVLAMVLFSSVASAADSKGNFIQYGVGNDTCNTFMTVWAMSQAGKKYGDFLGGFVTATNLSAYGTIDIIQGSTLENLLEFVHAACAVAIKSGDGNKADVTSALRVYLYRKFEKA